MENFRSEPFYYKVYGDYALFTDPISKGGGEKFTYSVPTYAALVGVTEAIYWKPTIKIIVDEVKIMRPIRTQTNGIRTLIGRGKENTNDRSYYTYLVNVEYLVKFHFEWNEARPDLSADRNPIKHQEIILRTLDKGGRHDIFLGTRECIGYVERLSKDVYEKPQGYYAHESMNFGIMFHSFIYPKKVESAAYTKLESNYAQIVMKNGVIQFPRSEECDIRNVLGNYSIPATQSEAIKPVEQELAEM